MDSVDEATVYCPICRAPTADLRRQEFPIVVVLIVFFAWNSETVTACPDCLRKHRGQRLLQSIFLSNILFPIMAIIYLGQGTPVSEGELEQYRVKPPEFAAKPPPPSKALRAVAVLVILAAAIAITLAVAALSQH